MRPHILGLKILLGITAVFSLGNAAVTLLSPAAQLSRYGLTTGAVERYMAQWAGVGSLVVGLLALFSWNATDFQARRAALLTLFGYFLAAAAVSVVGMNHGIMSAFGWLLVAVNLLFAAGYGYFLLRGRT